MSVSSTSSISGQSNDAQQVVLTIGDITFTYFETPQEINFGGGQSLMVHKMIGGQRVIDAMGIDEEPISWEGRFRGTDAIDRANALDKIRQIGLPVQLSWYNFKRLVVIKSFDGHFMQFYEVPYKITVEVLQNQDSPTPSAAQTTAGALTDQLTSVQTQSDDLGISSISSAISSITSLATAAGSLAQVPSAIANQAIGLAQGAVSTALSGQLSSITSGLSAAGNATQVAKANIGIAQNYLTSFSISNVQNTLSNMTANINIGF
jgi:hypothetical protein